ncbi:hypothetical protein CC86DRAFT_378586 [Ophiobolus disseminans]|uniref:Uncharacterized protein n=1 Tax=Ophiobolus disseminans TaxID=1469910 RepID=A0A6A7AGL5_9PLEO|nr:hypothetical protein CC86DRAFT_378586 [Ophiobolus disseminans]
MGPPAPPDAPIFPNDENPTCRNCGRAKHMLDLIGSRRYKKICKACRDAGIRTVSKAISRSMRRKLKKSASTASLSESGDVPALVTPSKRSALADFLPYGKASQDTPAEATARVEPSGSKASATTAVSGESSMPTSTQSNIVVNVLRSIAPQPPRLAHPIGPAGAVFTPYEESPGPIMFRRPSLPAGRRRNYQTPTSSRRQSISAVSSQAQGGDPTPDEIPDGEAFQCNVCYCLRYNLRRMGAGDSINECYYKDEFSEDVKALEDQYKKDADEDDNNPSSRPAAPPSGTLSRTPSATPSWTLSGSRGPMSSNWSLGSYPRVSRARQRSLPSAAARQREANSARLTASDPTLIHDEYDAD